MRKAKIVSTIGPASDSLAMFDRIEDGAVECLVETRGRVGAQKGINRPGTTVMAPRRWPPWTRFSTRPTA